MQDPCRSGIEHPGALLSIASRPCMRRISLDAREPHILGRGFQESKVCSTGACTATIANSMGRLFRNVVGRMSPGVRCTTHDRYLGQRSSSSLPGEGFTANLTVSISVVTHGQQKDPGLGRASGCWKPPLSRSKHAVG